MRWLLIWICVAGFSVSGFAQLTIHGMIRSAQKPVGYATIGVKGTTRSAMSNENGEFTLTVASLPQTIIVSAIGFEVESFEITTAQQTFQLKPKIYEINEVSVVGDVAYQIFDKAYKKLLKPGYAAFNGKVFYRLVTQNDTVYSELMEGFYDVQVSPTGFNDWQLKHGRYAIVDDYKQRHFVKSIDFSALVRYVNIINDHRSGVNFPEFPFQAYAKKRYEFSREGSVWLNNKEVSKIGFSPKKKSGDLFSGTAYIDEGTGNLHRLEVSFSKQNSNLVTTEKQKHNVVDLNIEYAFGFTEDLSGNMLLSWVNADLKYKHQYLSTLRPIHSQIQCFVYEKDKDVITSLRKTNTKESEIIFGSDIHHTQQTKTDDNNRSDYEAIKSRLYIKPFWDENTIISQTALQKKITQQFEQKGSFGMAYGIANDTLALLREGYAILGERVNKLISALPETLPADADATCMDVRLNGTIQASLCSRIFTSFNCYKDSFYIFVLPLADTSLTWMSDSIKADEEFSYMFLLYAKLTNVYAKKLKGELTGLKDPCLNESAIDKLIEKVNEELHQEQLLLLNDLWKDGQFPYWIKYIEKLEKEY